MLIKNFLQIGNPLLRRKCQFVRDVSSQEVSQVVKSLLNSMRQHRWPMIGLAAPQIGKNLQIFVTEIKNTATRNSKNSDKLRVYINPAISWRSKKEIVMYEACGSVADCQIFAPVKRPEKIVVKALDEKGGKFKIKAEGLLARVIQHEYDHLDGILFTDKISDMKQIMERGEYITRIKKSKKDKNG